jgi:Mrp family chromosome partitioning ATPase
VITREQIISHLKKVIDPEIGLDIVELGMVRDVRVDENTVSLSIALTVKGCPLSATIEGDIHRILKTELGIESVSVSMTSMTREELNGVTEKLQRLRAEQKVPGRAAGMSSGIDKLDRKGIRTVIAVMSGKGGVGKSFVASLLATHLRQEGHEVGLLDADITGPSIAKMFGLRAKPSADENGVIPAQTDLGIKVISMNLLLDSPETPVIWRGPIINGVIRQLFNDVQWGELHYLIVDLPPGTGDAPLTVFQSLPVDGVVIVSTPQDLAFMIVAKAINMAKQLKVPILGIVENMSYVKCPHCGKTIHLYHDSGTQEKALSHGVDFLGCIPFDPTISDLADHGRIEGYTSSEAKELVRAMRTKVASVVQMTSATPIVWSREKSQTK